MRSPRNSWGPSSTFQRVVYTTILARVPQQFVTEVLWPEFQELNRTVATFLEQVTDRVIAQGIDSDTSEVGLGSEQPSLADGASRPFEEAQAWLRAWNR
jgi:hypothetical protein